MVKRLISLTRWLELVLETLLVLPALYLAIDNNLAGLTLAQAQGAELLSAEQVAGIAGGLLINPAISPMQLNIGQIQGAYTWLHQALAKQSHDANTLRCASGRWKLMPLKAAQVSYLSWHQPDF